MIRVPTILAVPLALVLVVTLAPVQAMVTPMPGVVQQLVIDSLAKPPAPPPVHLDVVYRRGVLRSHRLDIYAPLGDDATEREQTGEGGAVAGGAAPVVVFFHGGSWVRGDKVTIRVVDRFLTRMREEGYYVVAVNYTTSVLRGLRGPVQNAQAAIDWIVENADAYQWDARRIGLYGVSAGGHVALMAASQMPPERFAFAFIECAPTDLIAMRDGDAFEQSSVFRIFPERVLRELSPIHLVAGDLPPVLVFHGDADRVVHVNQSIAYVAALRSAGGTAELVIYPDGDHAFLGFPDHVWYQQESRALDFFRREFARREPVRAP